MRPLRSGRHAKYPWQADVSVSGKRSVVLGNSCDERQPSLVDRTEGRAGAALVGIPRLLR